MQKFHLDFEQNEKGDYYRSLLLRALDSAELIELFEYSTEETSVEDVRFNRVTWWRKAT